MKADAISNCRNIPSHEAETKYNTREYGPGFPDSKSVATKKDDARNIKMQSNEIRSFLFSTEKNFMIERYKR